MQNRQKAKFNLINPKLIEHFQRELPRWNPNEHSRVQYPGVLDLSTNTFAIVPNNNRYMRRTGYRGLESLTFDHQQINNELRALYPAGHNLVFFYVEEWRTTWKCDLYPPQNMKNIDPKTKELLEYIGKTVEYAIHPPKKSLATRLWESISQKTDRPTVKVPEAKAPFQAYSGIPHVQFEEKKEVPAPSAPPAPVFDLSFNAAPSAPVFNPQPIEIKAPPSPVAGDEKVQDRRAENPGATISLMRVLAPAPVDRDVAPPLPDNLPVIEEEEEKAPALPSSLPPDLNLDHVVGPDHDERDQNAEEKAPALPSSQPPAFNQVVGPDEAREEDDQPVPPIPPAIFRFS